jgi:serine/threonine protein kinase
MNDNISRLSAALADRYAVELELGAGGMATVYLAEDLKHKRKVAAKVLRPELAAEPGRRPLRPGELVRGIEDEDGGPLSMTDSSVRVARLEGHISSRVIPGSRTWES